MNFFESIKQLIKENQPVVERDNYIYHYSTIEKLYPLNNISKGDCIITPDGVGKCDTIFNISGPAKANSRVEVYFGKHFKAYPLHKVFQYAIFHKLLNTYVPLSNHCYPYIFDYDDIVKYRITKHGYAMLAQSELDKREYIPIFRTKRGGTKMLKSLNNKGYKIVKK